MPLWRYFLRAWLLCFAGAAFFAMGYVDAYDAWPSIETAIAVVERGTIELPKDLSHGTVLTPGKWSGSFTKLGLLMPVLYLPAVVLGKSVCPAGMASRRCIDFFASWINPIATAAAVAWLFLYFTVVGNPRPWTVALAAGLGTMLLPYSKTSHREPVQALCLTAAYVLSSPSLAGRSQWAWLLGGSFLAAGILVKQAFVVVALPCLVWWVYQAFLFPRPWRRLAWFLIPFLGAALGWALFSLRAWGDPFFTGYSLPVTTFDETIWRTPLWRGVNEQLFSLRKGLFVHNPILLLLPYWVWRRRRDQPLGGLDLAVAVSFLAQVALYACWYTPTGDQALGPRYLLVVLPVLFLLIGREPLGLTTSRPATAAVTAVLAISVAFQLVQTSVKMQQYYTLQQRAHQPLVDAHWRVNAALFFHKVAGKPERYPLSLFGGGTSETLDVRDIASLAGLNYWWWHLARDGLRGNRRFREN